MTIQQLLSVGPTVQKEHYQTYKDMIVEVHSWEYYFILYRRVDSEKIIHVDVL